VVDVVLVELVLAVSAVAVVPEVLIPDDDVVAAAELLVDPEVEMVDVDV
jgi:hypothetical protein